MPASFPALLTQAAQLTGVAVPKAVGIIGDDVAVNAKQLLGLPRGRNLPALVKVMKGSLLNKAVLIPAATLISFAAPWAVLPLLAVGGFFLTSEAMEQVKGKGHGHGGHGDKPEGEKEKIAGALKVDAILSAEITVLTLSVVAGAPILTQLAVMAMTGIALTGVLYGVIGGLINMGEAGKWLEDRKGDGLIAKAARGLGRAMTKTMPPLMKGIGLVGTVALFMVGGELLLMGIPGGASLLAGAVAHIPALSVLQPVAEHLLMAVAGVAASFVSYPVMEKLEAPLEKLGAWFEKTRDRMFGKKTSAAPAHDHEHAPQMATELTPVGAAFANLPDVKAAMNDNAVRKIETQPQPTPAVKAPKINS